MTPEEFIAQQQHELDAMLSPLDIPRSWTQRELDAYETKRRELDAQIRTVRSATEVLAEVDPVMVDVTTYYEHGVTWRTEFAEKLLACPARPSSREEEYRVLGLKISIQALDRGFDFANECYPPNLPLFEAMTAAGYRAPADQPWNVFAGGWGSLPTVERRIADLKKRRDAAQRQLDRAMRDEAIPV